MPSPYRRLAKTSSKHSLSCAVLRSEFKPVQSFTVLSHELFLLSASSILDLFLHYRSRKVYLLPLSICQISCFSSFGNYKNFSVYIQFSQKCFNGSALDINIIHVPKYVISKWSTRKGNSQRKPKFSTEANEIFARYWSIHKYLSFVL